LDHRAFNNGDWVMIFQPSGLCRTAGMVHVRKLQKHWRGPFEVVSQINEVTYQIRINDRIVPVNLTRLKPYYLRTDFPTEPF
jgi:hypothetical protein